MKTRCPSCQTTFRVTPEQLKARAGKVRCGQCQTVFNALDGLLDETEKSGETARPATSAPPAPSPPPAAPGSETEAVARLASPAPFVALPDIDAAGEPATPPESQIAPETAPAVDLPENAGEPAATEDGAPITAGAERPAPAVTPDATEAPPAFEPRDETQADAAASTAPGAPPGAHPDVPPGEAPVDATALTAALAADPILPRDTTEIPGYSKWSEGLMSAPAAPAASASHKSFALIATLLALALIGQIVYHWRGEIALAAPSLRPALAAMSRAVGRDVPLPHNADLVSIEASDLQVDAARGNLLVLQATLRNRAPYAQAWPLLELSLTDTQDSAIVRRILQPADYLPTPGAAEQPFAAGSDVALRLWIEAKEIGAAGYRLYVFYP